MFSTLYFISLFQTIVTARRFEIDYTLSRRYTRLKAYSKSTTPSNDDDRDPVSHFLASVNDHFEHALQFVSDKAMVGITIQNRGNQTIIL